jgi:quinoprotein glucose dehydrogenase
VTGFADLTNAAPEVPMRAAHPFVAVVVLAASVGSSLAAPQAAAQGPADPPAAAGASTDWPSFGNDPGNTRYAPLEQIDRTSFPKLEIAWRWTSASQRVAAENPRVKPGQFKAVPVVVDGLLYVATEVSQVVALDAGTGEVVWEHDPRAYEAGRPANVGFQHRGVAYWSDSERRRIFVATHDRRLISLDARSGVPDPAFGDGGEVDLLPGDGEERYGRRVNERLVTHSSPPAVVADTVIVGSIVHDGATRQAAPPGHVQAFDARTGALRWVFHTIPQEGEHGVATWEGESWRTAGNTNVWTMMAVDEELGAVYLPVSTPTNDFYGGHRLGDNLFAESIVCLDARTGERRWHFQAVHHGLWDYDFPTAPNLVDITQGGERIPVLAQVSKQAFTYVLDRRTGEPVWPIEERPVPPSDVPGERASPTQPFPTRPAPFDRQGTSEEILIDLTPELRAAALETARRFRLGPLFTPPSIGNGTLALPGAGGGANWQGAAVDPETAVLYVPSMTAPGVNPLIEPDAARSDLRYVGSFFAGARGPQGLPLVKPPWGRVTAIDLDTGEHLWMTPNGFGPRSHPALAHLELGPLGGGYGAPLVTRTLLFVTQQRGRGEENTPRINVFDKQTGELLGHVPLPADPHGNPVTYLDGGKQFLVVAVGGGPFFGGFSEDAAEVDPQLAALLRAMPEGGETPELVAFALP